MLNSVEILAPAGSVGSLQASFKAGADAVYMGGSRFGARAYADNPDDEALLRAIDYAHLRGKRVYLTVNTLVRQSEMGMLSEYIGKIYEAGTDAVIVQDLGVMEYIADNYPALPLHISTQGCVTNSLAANYYPDSVTRIVPARELSIGEIAKLKKETGREIEVFVHGALCYSYSGNCLFSSMCGDRSGNRGRCAQPCRLKTEILLGNGERIKDRYLLSPKDICTIDNIPLLVKAGIDSFKIEGRMKSPEYAAYMSYAYKFALDIYSERGEEGFYKYIADNKSFWNELKTGMADLYNRGGFTKGYAFSETGPGMMSVKRPNHQGTYVGEGSIENGFARICLADSLYKGDVIELRGNNEKEEYFSFTTPVEYKVGDTISFRAVRKERERFHNHSTVSAVRIRCNSLMEKINEEYISNPHRIDISAYLFAKPGEKLMLSLAAKVVKDDMLRDVDVTVYGQEVSVALNAPVTEESVREKLLRSGDSEFNISECRVELCGSCFIPKSFIGNIRREAIDKLRDNMTGLFRRNRDCKDEEDTTTNLSGEADMSCTVINNPEEVPGYKEGGDGFVIKTSVYSREQLEALLEAGAKHIIIDLDSEDFSGDLEELFDRTGNMGCSLYVKTRRIADDENIKFLRAFLEKYASYFYGAYAKNLSCVCILKEYFENVYADKWLYVTNSWSSLFLKKIGIRGFVYSTELSYKEMTAIDKSSICSELTVYGAEELMISKQCMKKTVGRCNKTPEFLLCSSESGRGTEFYCYQMCSQCRNILFDKRVVDLSQRMAEIKKLRPSSLIINYVTEGGSEAADIYRRLINLSGNNEDGCESDETKYEGHFLKGIL